MVPISGISVIIVLSITGIVQSHPSINSVNSQFHILSSPGFCPPYKYTCNNNGGCIPGHQRCDGHPDCQNRDDEVGCICARDQYQCLDGQCISRTDRCNGINNCRNEEDELHCPCPQNKFRCTENGQCISLRYVCDGFNDCQNGSDEQRCPTFQQKYRTMIQEFIRKIQGTAIRERLKIHNRRY